MSATLLIGRFGKNVTLKRQSAGSYVNGVFVDGTITSTTILVSAQPLQGRELLNLPEAQRTRQYLKGYSDTELFTARQSSSQKADVLTINGRDYEVQAVEYWESTGNTIVPYWKILLAEVNP